MNNRPAPECLRSDPNQRMQRSILPDPLPTSHRSMAAKPQDQPVVRRWHSYPRLRAGGRRRRCSLLIAEVSVSPSASPADSNCLVHSSAAYGRTSRFALRLGHLSMETSLVLQTHRYRQAAPPRSHTNTTVAAYGLSLGGGGGSEHVGLSLVPDHKAKK